MCLKTFWMRGEGCKGLNARGYFQVACGIASDTLLLLQCSCFASSHTVFCFPDHIQAKHNMASLQIPSRNKGGNAQSTKAVILVSLTNMEAPTSSMLNIYQYITNWNAGRRSQQRN